MRTCVRISILLAAVSVSGCVQSVNRFYVREAVIPSPVPDGQWVVVDDDGDREEGARPWVFAGNRITAREENGTSVDLTATYFKVDDTTFVDTQLWQEWRVKDFGVQKLHLVPVHAVARVDLDGDNLSITMPDVKWLMKAIGTKDVSLPFVEQDGGFLVMTASPQQWMAFLKKYRNDKRVFGEYRLAFRRQKK